MSQPKTAAGPATKRVGEILGADSQATGVIADMRRVLAHTSPRRRRQLPFILLLMLVGAVAEVVSIGAILPFLTLVAIPERVTQIGAVQPVLDFLGLKTPFQITAAAAALFALSAVVAAVVRLVMIWANQRFIYGVAQELGVAVYRRTLHQPYSYHTSTNTSQIIAAINKVQQVTNGLLVPLMQAASAGVIAVFILIGLLFVDAFVALAAGASFGLLYLLVIAAAKKVMHRNGAIIAMTQGERIQAANEGLGGIRDVLLDRSQGVFVARLADVERRLRRAQATNTFLHIAPRYIVEGLGMVMIAGIALALSQREGGLMEALPVLGALALGAQRLLPLLQQFYAGWSAYMTHGRSLQDVMATLQLPDAPQFLLPPSANPLPFEQAVTFEKVGFAYPVADRPALDGIDLSLPKGARIGFVGKTGSGKSTMMDLVLGLLTPTSGRILIDGVELTDANRSAWQRQIAHVPQFIYLADASVAENIAFGVAPNKIDHDQVRQAATQAELDEVIEALPLGYDTPVGERGVRLSGGQRQRVGIARALYKQAGVLVFDEATSALDNETEKAVMQAIERLDRSLTILIIAHRLSTVQSCDMLVTLEKGRMKVKTAQANA